MKRRRHVQHLLSAYIDGDLSPARARAVAAHLEECPECVLELEQWRAVLRLVSQQAAVACPIDCAEAVLSWIEASAVPSPTLGRPQSRRGMLLPAMGLLFSLTLGSWLWSVRSPGRTGSGRAAELAAGAGRTAAVPTLTPAQMLGGDGGDRLARRTNLYSRTSTRSLSDGAVLVHAPVRLEEAFGRSDSLILAADFAEDDR